MRVQFDPIAVNQTEFLIYSKMSRRGAREWVVFQLPAGKIGRLGCKKQLWNTVIQQLRHVDLVLGMLLFGPMNVLFEAATIEGRARALGKRHQKQHLYDDAVQAKSNDPNHWTERNSRFRGWLGLMKSRVKNLLALAVCAGAALAHPAHASVVAADWAFPGSGTATAPINATSSTDTTGTPALDGTIFAGVASHGGTADYTTSGGLNVLSFTYAGFNPNDVNGHTLTLTLTANTAMTVSGLTYSTSYNQPLLFTPLTQTWTYAISGGSSGTVGAVTLNNGNMANESLDPNVTLNAGQTITLTDTFSGVFGFNGTLDFANISIAAVPEPITIALTGFGMVLGASVVIQRAKGKVRV